MLLKRFILLKNNFMELLRKHSFSLWTNKLFEGVILEHDFSSIEDFGIDFSTVMFYNCTALNISYTKYFSF